MYENSLLIKDTEDRSGSIQINYRCRCISSLPTIIILEKWVDRIKPDRQIQFQLPFTPNLLILVSPDLATQFRLNIKKIMMDDDRR